MGHDVGVADTAEQRYESGRHLATRGRYIDAKAELTAAAAASAADDIELWARATGTLAYVLAKLGDVDAGERMCLAALEVDGLSVAAVAQLQGQLGSLALERGRLDDALTWLGRSIDGLDEHPVRQANMRMNRSLVLMQRGLLDDAVADLEAAEVVYREEEMPHEAGQAVHNRGYVRMLAGDLVAALRTMQGVRQTLDDESEIWAAINELDRAEVLREAGLVTEAERSLDAVARALERLHVPGEQAAADYQLARSLLSHDPRGAMDAASRAARRFRRMGSDGWATRAEAIGLRARLAVGRLERSGDLVTRFAPVPSETTVGATVTRLRRLGFRPEADALRIDATLARLRLRRPVTTPRFRVDDRTPLETALLVHELRARDAERHGDDRAARRHAARGLDLLDSSFSDGGSLDLQSVSSMRGSGLITAGLSAAIRSGDPEVLFEWSERARLLRERIVAVRPSPDPRQATDLAELRVLRMADPQGDWLAGERAQQLRDRTRERQWSATGVAGRHRRVTLAEAQAALADDELLVSFLFDGENLVALVVTSAGPRITPLDAGAIRAALRGLRADLDVSASVRSGPMAGVVRQALHARLETLGHLLVEPANPSEEVPRRVAIAAPGLLSGLPWTMLPCLTGVAITVVGSASGWIRDRRAARSPLRAAALVAGPRVRRADEEVDLASSSWTDAAVLRGDAATVDGVTRAASDVDVLHIAAHGRHSVDNPMFSGLDLADGTLFGYDIDQIPRMPDTVVLSACEVGRSSVRWGEEAVGMTRVWLHGGARCVVAAPVVVADDAACELLGAMHAGLAEGMAPADALAEAAVRTGIVAPFQAHGAGF